MQLLTCWWPTARHGATLRRNSDFEQTVSQKTKLPRFGRTVEDGTGLLNHGHSLSIWRFSFEDPCGGDRHNHLTSAPA